MIKECIGPLMLHSLFVFIKIYYFCMENNNIFYKNTIFGTTLELPKFTTEFLAGSKARWSWNWSLFSTYCNRIEDVGFCLHAPSFSVAWCSSVVSLPMWTVAFQWRACYIFFAVSTLATTFKVRCVHTIIQVFISPLAAHEVAHNLCGPLPQEHCTCCINHT